MKSKKIGLVNTPITRHMVEHLLVKAERRDLPDGVPCQHTGCLSHISHPCEGCGRIGGRTANLLRIHTDLKEPDDD